MIETAGQTAIARAAIAGLAERLCAEGRDPDALVAEAVRAEEGEAALALALAARVADRPCHVQAVTELLARADYLDDIPLLIAATRGDRVGALLDAAERGGVDWERQALFLYLAAAIAEGAPPDRLVAGLRRLARRDLREHEGIYVGLAARMVGDPDVEAVAGRWIALADHPDLAADAEHLLAPLRRPLLETLPDEAPPRTVSGFTVRRAAKKVGRNEPCPCGSGMKYKKCCERRDRERLADPSPVPGVTMQEYLARPHEFLSPIELGRLRAHELAGLPLAELPTAHLEAVVRTLILDWAWTDADRALAELYRRKDAAYAPDEYRLLLVSEAWRARERELAWRHLDQLGAEHDPDEVAVLRELFEPGPDTLARIDEMAARGLGEEPWRLTELAMNLLPEYPAIGLMVARGAIVPEQTDDIHFLLDEIEDARDRLQLPPGDAAAEIARALFGADQKEADPEDPEELRARLEKANRRADALERELQLKQEKLEAEARQKEASAGAPERESERKAEAAAEAELLRAKVSHLKSLISDSKEERRRLQQEIEELSRRTEPRSEAPPAEPTPPAPAEASPPEAQELPAFRRPLVPELSSRAREAIAAADPKLARRAMQTTFDLALGQRRSAAQVKRLERVGDLWSARVGIHHRLLFRFDERAGSLEVVDLIDREELKTRLKHLS